MINQETIADASRAISFADDVRAAYDLTAQMCAKIQRYIDGAAAVAQGTADAREAKFVRLAQDVVDPEDLARIGALLPTLLGFVATLEADYSDFLTTT